MFNQKNVIQSQVVHLDLGRGEHDPMRDTWFYNPDNPDVATRAKDVKCSLKHFMF